MPLSDDAIEVDRLLSAAAETIGKVRYCWLLTSSGEGGIRCRPMGHVRRDPDEDEWTLRCLTDGRSSKAADIRRASEVSIIFQNDPDDAFVALMGKASLAEGKPEVRARWKTAYNVYFPDGPDRSSAIFVTINVMRVELWVRGVTSEPFGLHTTVIERDAKRAWRLTAE